MNPQPGATSDPGLSFRTQLGIPGFLIALLFAVLLLASCVGNTPLPDYHFYRLSIAPPAQTLPAPPIKGLLLVETPRAPAVYVSRSIAYSDAAPHLSLEHYHYHAWIDTPARLLQQELVRHLQAMHFGSAVVSDAGRVTPEYRISGEIRRFERLKTTRGWEAVVALDLRVEGSSPETPLLVRGYERSELAADASMEATVKAFSAATTAIFQQFASDLADRTGVQPAKAALASE